MTVLNNKEDYKKLMENEFVVIDFFADWCGPCKLVSSYVEKVADTYKDKVSIVKLNIENEGVVEKSYPDFWKDFHTLTSKNT